MRGLTVALLLGLALFGSTGAARAAPIEVTDEFGRMLRLERSPQRIVSLLPSLTETVCALGACERLVGVDRYSDHPAQVQRLPRLGGLDDVQIERIVALRPDLVLLSPSSRVQDRLAALGLKVLVLETRNHADLRRVLATVGRVLEAEDPMKVWQRIDAAMDAAAASVPPALRGMRVYYEVDSAPYAAGESSFIGETLARLGLRNIVPAALGPFPKLNPEFVVQADPQILMIAQRNAARLAERPGWARISALREQRQCVFGPAESDLMARPGPRLAEAAQAMATCLRRLAGTGARP